MKLISGLLLFIFPILCAAADWIDRSHTIFLPKTIHTPLALQTDFPNFWWNFAIIAPVDGKANFTQAEAFCTQVQTLSSKLIKKSACPQLSSVLPLLESWSQDIFLRQMAPQKNELLLQFQNAQTKASLPIPTELLKVLRRDPLETYKDLQNILLQNVSLGFEKENGFFLDKTSQKIVIPVQFAFSPQLSELSREVMTNLTGNDWHIVGPHISSLENEQQVLKDVDLISVFGSVLLILQLAFVFITRRYSYLWLLPPMAVGVLAAGACTLLIYGNIHGLTLSLGTGIIALALDYGLHSIHNIQWKGVWKANLFGLLTTYAGLLAISLSAIPLLRQMMVFSTLGLSFSYTFYYFVHQRYPDLVAVRAFNYVPRVRLWKTVVSLSFVVVAVIGVFVLRPDLNMHQFDSQSAKSRAGLVWLYSHIHQRMPLFSVHNIQDNSFALAKEQLEWGKLQGIGVSNFKRFLASPEEQIEFQKSWTKLCPLDFFSSNEKILFEPFLVKWPCDRTEVRPLGPTNYIGDTVSGTHWLTTWFPENDNQVRAIKNYDSKAQSLREILQDFPIVLQQELLWMLPLSLFICLLLLWWYYQKEWLLSALSLTPFLTGVGTYFLCVFIFNWGFSFISIIALIMVFGFSIDYGIFAANLFVLKNPPKPEGVWTCLLLGATVTILGFLPLMFCKHPVLVHLGQTLVMGSVGTWIGTAWGIPGVFAIWKKPLLKSEDQ
ncbi:MAG: hypothetical protein IT287_08075 [Bdellovibrionaceae bacterium]|nr:hypothetical protein [Pseudobdellovibrionaceae bacterium]